MNRPGSVPCFVTQPCGWALVSSQLQLELSANKAEPSTSYLHLSHIHSGAGCTLPRPEAAEERQVHDEIPAGFRMPGTHGWRWGGARCWGYSGLSCA